MYLMGLFAMDSYVGLDVRQKLATIPYDKFLQKYTKKIRVDSYSHKQNEDLF